MINDLIEYLTKTISDNVIICYYEKAPNDAKFPFCLIPTINYESMENYGQSDTNVDVYILTSEYSTPNAEEIADKLIKVMDRDSHIGEEIATFTTVTNMRTNYEYERDLISKKISLNVRMVYK